MACHNAAAGGALGLETAQLNRTLTYPDGTTSNQLAKLEAMGVFSATAPLPATRPALSSPSSATASVEQKARSYLHANCAFCHRPQGPGRGAADFRFSRTLLGTHVCNTAPEAGDLGVAGAKLLVPGDPASSLISIRMHRTDGDRMPPLASAVVDPTGTDLVDAWIRSLTACQ
jgi:mono/diheme cytochrome c family protein